MRREDIEAWCWHEAFEFVQRQIKKERATEKAARRTPEYYMKMLDQHAKRLAKECQ